MNNVIFLSKREHQEEHTSDECRHCPKDKQDKCLDVMTRTFGEVAPCFPNYKVFKAVEGKK